MNGIKQRVILEKRIAIGADGAWVRRDGNAIEIEYDYAGRVTKEAQHFYAHDIRALHQFVEETEQSA